MQVDKPTDRIVSAALGLFIRQGVKRTNVEDIAYHAGVTRITVYRYFGDKRGLVRAVCMQVAGIFQRAAEAGPAVSVSEIDARLNRLGMELSALPSGNLLGRLEEVSRLYPDVYEEFRRARQSAVDSIFHQALAAATREHTLRDGLNLDVLKTIFLAAVMGLIENPALISSSVPLTEIFATVAEVFRHGILKEQAGDPHDG
jgi:AcrR family transcriptional regulator